jgi:glycine hydroxymethyltransferase
MNVPPPAAATVDRTALHDSLLDRPLAEVDPEVAAAVAAELRRQQSTLEMIASENFAPVSVMQAQGSVLTNKYAEGYPGRRYYGGCEHVDVTEQLAIDRVKDLFGARFANVQPHSGAQANTAVFFALLNPGDTILGLSLAHGGHLTHGMKINYSGKMFDVVPYQVRPDDGLVDMDQVERLAREHRPRMIIAGWSAYPRQLDFPRFRAIADEVGAYLMVDMAHFAGLVAAGLHPSPIPHAHVTTTTTHKTLGGPRGGVILTDDPDIAKKVNSAVFPGMQGGPLEHVIAAKAVAFRLAAGPEFRERQERTLQGARLLAERLSAPDTAAAGVRVLTGGTDVHLVLVDLRDADLDGRQAEDRLHDIGITVNRNAVPFDPRPPMVTSGLRIGTPALATRGFDADDFREVADIIALALLSEVGEDDLAGLRARVSALAASRPLYPSLGTGEGR